MNVDTNNAYAVNLEINSQGKRGSGVDPEGIFFFVVSWLHFIVILTSR
jgi:hypothetical protein